MAEIGLFLRGIARVCRRHDNTITYLLTAAVVYGHGGMQRVGCVAAMALTTMGHRHTLTPFGGGTKKKICAAGPKVRFQLAQHPSPIYLVACDCRRCRVMVSKAVPIQHRGV